jgi:hypothetical protein
MSQAQILRRHEDTQQIEAYTSSFKNPGLDLDDELHRRFTQYTPEPTMTAAPKSEKRTKPNKGSVSSQK